MDMCLSSVRHELEKKKNSKFATRKFRPNDNQIQNTKVFQSQTDKFFALPKLNY